MKTRSSSRSSSKRSNYSKNNFDLPDDEEEPRTSRLSNIDYNGGGEGMLPVFLADLGHHHHHHRDDLVEITLDIDDENIIVRSVTPTSHLDYNNNHSSGGGSSDDQTLDRSLSVTARIRRKFPWLRSAGPSRGPSRAQSETGEEPNLVARDARKVRARLDRNNSSAQRALKGLRFINQTTGAASNHDEMWCNVEARFRKLAKDELLAREDFGECIGKK